MFFKNCSAPLALIILGLLTVFSFFSPAWGEQPKIRADAAILMDYQTGQVFFEKKARDRMHPASTTKIITALIALEQGKLSDAVTISQEAGMMNLGSSLNLRPGDIITLGNLIKGALMLSANDSTVAIGQHLAGDADIFVRMMNQKARSIGAYDTQFVNTNGFSKPNHYTTAYDLALMARYAMHNPAFARQVGAREDKISWAEPEKELEVNNTNKLLWLYPGATGIKTGTTSAAGGCLVSSATRDGRTLIGVVLRSSRRYEDSMALFNYGFGEIREYTLVKEGRVVAQRPVQDGRFAYLKIAAGQSIKRLIAREELKEYQIKIYLPKELQAPIFEGQKLGYAAVFYQKEEIARVPLIAAEEIKKKSIFSKIFD